MSFAKQEYLGRVERLWAEMRRRNLAAILIDDNEALAYFIGYEVSLSFYRACVIPLEGDPFLVLRALDVAPARETSWLDHVVGYPDWGAPDQALAREIIARGLGKARIGIDLGSHALTVQMYHALKLAMPGVEFVDVAGLPWQLRKIKSPAEIEKLRAACKIADLTTEAIIAAASPGFTERRAASMAIESFVRLGGDPGLLGIITAGKGWDFLHGHLHDRPLEAGDVLHLELCPRVAGYSARMMRDVVIGPMSAELRRAADTLRSVQDKQIAALKPGAAAKEVDLIMRQGLLDTGLRKTYDNITGYTIGYYSDYLIRGSDFTWIFHPKAEWTVEAGMVFHMYTSAVGISLSDTVLVRQDRAAAVCDDAVTAACRARVADEHLSARRLQGITSTRRCQNGRLALDGAGNEIEAAGDE
jgi:Xaa-Pro aminopeptidase